MNEETTAATEVTETIPTEETSLSMETTVPVITEQVLAETEETWEYPEKFGAAETVEIVEVVNYTPVIEESTRILANMILCGVLIVVGLLAAFKFWGAK